MHMFKFEADIGDLLSCGLRDATTIAVVNAFTPNRSPYEVAHDATHVVPEAGITAQAGSLWYRANGVEVWVRFLAPGPALSLYPGPAELTADVIAAALAAGFKQEYSNV